MDGWMDGYVLVCACVCVCANVCTYVLVRVYVHESMIALPHNTHTHLHTTEIQDPN